MCDLREKKKKKKFSQTMLFSYELCIHWGVHGGEDDLLSSRWLFSLEAAVYEKCVTRCYCLWELFD